MLTLWAIIMAKVAKLFITYNNTAKIFVNKLFFFMFFGSPAKPCVMIKTVSHPEGDLCGNPQ